MPEPIECPGCIAYRDALADVRKERDELKETLFRITRLAKPETQTSMTPVGGFESPTQFRLRKLQQVRAKMKQMKEVEELEADEA